MASSGKIEIKKFNGQRFELWKLKMEDLLVDKDQWTTVDLAMAKALRDMLGTLYQSKSLVNKLFLQKKLYNLRMKDGDPMTEHLNALNTVVSQLASVDIKILDEDKCISLLCSLLDSWDCLVIAIGSNATTLQFDEIVSSLPTEEMRRKNMESQNGDALSKTRIIGCGKVKLKLQSGRVRTLPGVLHIPALTRNLISVSELDDAGVKTVFEKDTCKMVRGALVLLWGVRIATLYKLQGSTFVDGCNSSVVPESGVENLVVSGEKTMLWHQTLRHIGEKGLRILHGKGMVEGMNNSSLDFYFCENCVYGKQNRMTSQGIHGYISLRINLKSDRFKEFKALVENQIEKKIKALRTDNGGEFCNKEFKDFYKKCGIARQKTTPYTL
eukprot:PITA_27526